MASLLAAAGLMVIALVVAPVREPSLTLRVYVPAVLKIRLLKLATPLTAATDVVLPLANPPGPLNTVTVTVDVFDVTVLPEAFSTATERAVPMPGQRYRRSAIG